MFLGAEPEPQETGRREGPHPRGSGMRCRSKGRGMGPRNCQLGSRDGWGPAPPAGGTSHVGPGPSRRGWVPIHSPPRWDLALGRQGESRSCLPGVTLVLSPQGKRYKNSLETVGTPDSGRGRSEKKAIK